MQQIGENLRHIFASFMHFADFFEEDLLLSMGGGELSYQRIEFINSDYG